LKEFTDTLEFRLEQLPPIDYNLLAREIKANDKHFAIMESHSSNSYMEKEAFAYMGGASEEVAMKFEEQARV